MDTNKSTATRAWYFLWCYLINLAGHFNEAREMEAGSFHRSADWQSPVSRFKKRRAVCPSVFVCAACACVEVICIHLHCAVALFCLIWARCSLPAITWHCRVHSRCVFLSAPLGAYVIAQCWWEQPWLRVPSHTAITLMVVQEKNTVKIKKVPGASKAGERLWPFPPPAEPRRGW